MKNQYYDQINEIIKDASTELDKNAENPQIPQKVKQ